MWYFQNVPPAKRNLVKRGEDVISDLFDTEDRTFPRIASFVITKVPISSQMLNVFSKASTLLLPYPYLSSSAMPYPGFVMPDDALFTR